MTTPKEIKQLNKDQIFVFGSNLNGNHAGGAALQAKQWGAIDGQGEGLQGQTYAFPTLDTNMKKVSKKDLLVSKEKLYQCAKENPDKQFFVTKVGCGIAGCKEETMKEIFKGDKPVNIILPAGWYIIRGYKAFDKGLLCRGFQYELGKDFYHEGTISPCNSGFHFCKSLGDVYGYYSFGNDIVVGDIETEGDVIDDGDKSVTNHIRIVRILNAEQASNNSGIFNTGHSNTGHRNTGDWNTGDRNTGDWNTGHRNTGHRNTGDWNTGHSNTGDWNTGHRNTGDWNTGHRNTGHRNTGHRNTGHRNTGDWNTGHWNTGHRNTGYFNTINPDILIFNKKCSLEKWNKAIKPSCLYFNIKKWVDFSDMTDEEKIEFPSAKTAGGYVKQIDFKEAFTESMKKASKEDIEMIKKLPNFSKKIFKEISGFKII